MFGAIVWNQLFGGKMFLTAAGHKEDWCLVLPICLLFHIYTLVGGIWSLRRFYHTCKRILSSFDLCTFYLTPCKYTSLLRCRPVGATPFFTVQGEAHTHSVIEQRSLITHNVMFTRPCKLINKCFVTFNDVYAVISLIWSTQGKRDTRNWLLFQPIHEWRKR